MRKDLTDITILLDRSGSMYSVVDDTIGGINKFIEVQTKAPGNATLTLIQFDNQYETVYLAKPVEEAPKLTKDTFVPRGSTALYDAICRAMDDTGRRLEATADEDRPGLVIFAIMTDGYENSSKTRKIHDVNDRISTQRDQYSWQILFLGANQDAIAEASKMGINPGFAMSYAATGPGTHAAIGATGLNVTRARAAFVNTGSSAAAGQMLNYSKAQRDEQENEMKKGS